jgi:SAM-dependent methyltransferase
MDSSGCAVFPMNDGFYRAFEERYRGSRELIKARLAVYLQFVEPLLNAYPAAAALDLGCGRGEWVELLVETGFAPMGIDTDMGMLDCCLKLALPVEHGDALGYLCALPDESQAVISAIHLVEHITFDQLRMLVGEALRVLKPGGLLIMETPNPENILVATRNFYLDPTHQRPIPSMLLAFVAEYAGFIRVKTLRLQESKDIVNRSDVSLQDVINGASPDYSVIAQKSASENILALTSNPFGLIYGLSLEDLMGRWDSRFEGFAIKAQQAEAIAQQAEAMAQQAETTAQQALALAENAPAKVECRNSFPIAIHNSILGRIVMRVRWLIEYMRGSR